MTWRLLALLPVVVAVAAAQAKELEALVDQLGSADGRVRSQAYTVLVRDQRPEVIALIGKRIETMPLDGQQFAFYVLQQHPLDATRALFGKLVKAEQPFLRVAAAAQLVRAGERGPLAEIAKALVVAAAAERQTMLYFLWGIEDARVADGIRGWLGVQAPGQLVVSVLQHLARIEKARSEATITAVRALLASKDQEARAAALLCLVSVDGGEAMAKDLVAMLDADAQLLWQIESLFEPDRKYPKVLVERLAKALAAPRMRHDVTRLARIVRAQSPEAATAALRGLLDHDHEDVRAEALQVLATIPGALETKELQKLLQGGSAEQRVAAASVLRRMDDPSGLPVVLELAGKPGNHLLEAVRALGGFRAREVVPVLLDRLDDANAAVRKEAWLGLQRVLHGLFPYRRFDFGKSGYAPDGADRAAGIRTLRAWWASVQ